MVSVDVDLLDRLPTRQEVGREITETTRRARALRALYRLLRRIEAEGETATDTPSNRREVPCGN